MKNFYTAIIIALMPVAGMAQIGVGTTSLDATAMLQVNASATTNAKGFLGPRVALTSTSANSPFSVTPATGLMVYNTATAGTGAAAVTPGYYSYTGTGWERLAAPPTTFVGGTAGGYFIGSSEYAYGSTLPVWGPLGNITLPPGRWEVIAEYTCVPGGNYTLGSDNLNNWENTYWLSTSDTRSALSTCRYPLNLSGLSSGAPTSHAMFTGAAVSVQKVLTIERYSGSTIVHSFPKQSMKFYINNPGTTDQTYWLHYAESLINKDLPNDPGPWFTYQPNSGENRLYAVMIN